MKQTINLLRTIGSPFISETKPPKDKREALELYRCATKNRMPLLYLTALKKWKKLGNLEKTYYDMREKCGKTYDAISRVSNVLKKADITHTIFKTIRPYPETTVDIDVLILKSDTEYKKSVKALIEAGYKKLGSGPHSTTVRDPHIDIGVDLYQQVAVSQVIYLDKDKIGSCIIEKTTPPHGEPARTLSPPADLIAIIAHSVIKEHMYTLSEYYSTLHYLAEMNSEEVLSFTNMTRENAVTHAAKTHVSITATLHKATHGETPRKVKRILNDLGTDSNETRRLTENKFKTPHKFQILTVGKALLEKIKQDKTTRKSIAEQMTSMMKPNFTENVIKKIVEHRLRETY